MPSKLVALMVSAVLAASMFPMVAFAQPTGLESATVPESGAAVTTQASKTKTMYLLKKVGSYKVSYSGGLVSKISSSAASYTYGYDGNRMTSYHQTAGWNENDGTFAYDSKGRLSHVLSGGSNGYMTYQESLSYDSKGRLSKLVHDRTGDLTTYSFKYGKKNRVSSITSSHSSYFSSTGASYKTRYTYDKKGNLSKWKTSYSTAKIKNTYKSGRLVKRVLSDKYSKFTKKYSYKKVKVPTERVSQVKKQQWAMLNYEVDYKTIPVAPLYMGV